MKQVLIFIGLKLAEVIGVIGLIWFMFSMRDSHMFLVIITWMVMVIVAIVVPVFLYVLIRYMIPDWIKLNWKLASKLAKGDK